ncbi:hypothetical protein BN1708_015630, partial [Verticillium longisporum]
MEVIGVDLSPIQPEFVAPNSRFEIDDLEDEWIWLMPFHFIFARGMIESFKKPQESIRDAFRNLEPNGYLELQDHAFPLECDDDTLKNTNLQQWSSYLVDAGKLAERPITAAPQFQHLMEEEGFVDIVVTKKKWPTNDWDPGQEQKELG